MQLSVQTEISFLISSISIQTYRTYLQSGSQNDLLLNVSKTKEMIVFLERRWQRRTPLSTSGEQVKC